MTTARDFAAARAKFPHTKKVVYFNSASFGPFSTVVKKAVNDNVDFRMAGGNDSRVIFETRKKLRGEYARLIGARKREVGLGLNTSFGLNVAAFGLPLKKGDEILISDIEFPAIPYTFRAAAEARGLRIKYVKSRDRCFDIGLLEKAITKRSRVLAISWVQFFNGYKNDLVALGEICRKHGMYFIVDGIQGAGVEPINVRKLGIDVFTSGCQKWLLAPQGCSFFYLSDEVRDSLKPPFMSWLGVDWPMDMSDLFKFDLPYFDSAQRFEMGYYVSLNLYGQVAALEPFERLGVPNIQRHNYDLIDQLADYIRANPFFAITSCMEPKHRSSIFTFTCPDYKKLWSQIFEKHIMMAHREGSLRVAAHLFNNRTDIDRLIAVLDDFAKRK